MNLYHLRYFVTLAHLEHYTKAAQQLSITQPSLSNAISLLEEELGIRLFEKEGRNVVLTKYGKTFLNSVEKSLDILDSSVKELKNVGMGKGKIDLGFLRALGTEFIPKVCQNFLDENTNKDIKFNFNTASTTSDIIEGLKNRNYDIAFCSKIEKEANIDFTPVANQKLVLIVSLDHPLASKDSVNLRETITYPQIIFNEKSGLRPIIDNLFKKINEKPSISYEVEEDQVIAGLVAKNFGIAIVPYMNILNFLDVKSLDINYPSWERNFYIANLKDSYLSPAVREFKNFVITNYSKSQI
ncbi:LysR family transcriptional regulator [Terrisporobacter petrolearius]|uniref:LysR family transcriptional regulator n=1 Tax=Terrisporobacter petrolearius TaxID=1460447 RepID=UPI001D16AC83|nr:LysR family transcriptional regulator [Terrisporobacter petrolearius]MCC3865760.1 LysR family transcriptional regulator [Terrisporobacter petrolearius]